jgi:hypothetical protein
MPRNNCLDTGLANETDNDRQQYARRHSSARISMKKAVAQETVVRRAPSISDLDPDVSAQINKQFCLAI